MTHMLLRQGDALHKPALRSIRQEYHTVTWLPHGRANVCKASSKWQLFPFMFQQRSNLESKAKCILPERKLRFGCTKHTFILLDIMFSSNSSQHRLHTNHRLG